MFLKTNERERKINREGEREEGEISEAVSGYTCFLYTVFQCFYMFEIK
jgi:hypothetical protein